MGVIIDIIIVTAIIKFLFGTTINKMYKNIKGYHGAGDRFVREQFDTFSQLHNTNITSPDIDNGVITVTEGSKYLVNIAGQFYIWDGKTDIPGVLLITDTKVIKKVKCASPATRLQVVELTGDTEDDIDLVNANMNLSATQERFVEYLIKSQQPKK